MPPLDPRHFRLPNILFKMVKVHRSVVAHKAPVSTGRPGSAVPIPREHDPKIVAFRVPLALNKLQIKNYLEELYQVQVKKVSTLIYLGKDKRDPRSGMPIKRPDYKKAYITLKQPFKYPTLAEQRKLQRK